MALTPHEQHSNLPELAQLFKDNRDTTVHYTYIFVMIFHKGVLIISHAPV